MGSEVQTGTNVGMMCLVDVYLLLLFGLCVCEKEERLDVHGRCKERS